jgi:hypothetical protein
MRLSILNRPDWWEAGNEAGMSSKATRSFMEGAI